MHTINKEPGLQRGLRPSPAAGHRDWRVSSPTQRLNKPTAKTDTEQLINLEQHRKCYLVKGTFKKLINVSLTRLSLTDIYHGTLVSAKILQLLWLLLKTWNCDLKIISHYFQWMNEWMVQVAAIAQQHLQCAKLSSSIYSVYIQ